MMKAKSMIAFCGWLFWISIPPSGIAEEAAPAPIAQLGGRQFVHLDQLKHLTFSPNGSLFAVTAEDGVVWDISTAQKLRSFSTGLNHGSTAFSRDGRTVAVSTRDSIDIYNAHSGERTAQILETAKYGRLAISADGRQLAQANGTEITLWDVGERKRLRRWQHEGEGVNDMAFSPSGDRLAVAARYKGPLAIYDLSPGDNQRVELEGQSDSSEWVAFSPDGKMVAGSCSEPRGSKPVRRASSLRVWDAATGEVIHNIKGSVSGGDFSPDSRLLAAAKGSKNVILYNTTTGQEVQRLPEVNKSVRLVAFSQDGAVLAAADVHRIRLWQTDSWKEIEFGSGHQEPILAMAFSPDGRTIATGGLDGQLIQWSWPGGKEQHRIKGIASSWGIQNLAFSPDGHMIGATGWNNRGDMYFVFDTATGTPISQFGKDTRGGGVISFLPGSKQVITDGKDGAIRVWDAKTGTLDRQIGEHESRIIALHPMAGSHKAWWAGAYQGLGLRDLTTGENELLINGDYNSYSYVPLVVSPQQDWLAIGRHVWDLKTHEIITKLPGVPCAFSSDGRLLALAKGETVAIWERLTRREIHSFDGGGQGISAIDFSPDSTVLVAARGWSAWVWDMTGRGQNGFLHNEDFTEQELESFWQTLGGGDAWAAHQAAWSLAAGGNAAVTFLAHRLLPATAPDPRELQALRDQFSDPDFDAREIAAREIVDLGIELTPEEWKRLQRPAPLCCAMGSPIEISPEGKLVLVEPAEPHPVHLLPPPELLPLPERLRASRAVLALQHSPSAAAKSLLQKLASGAATSPLTREAKAALNSLIQH